MPISLPAEGQGPKEVEKKTEQLERAFKPMPFLSKFWEIQVRLDSVHCLVDYTSYRFKLDINYKFQANNMFSRV